MLTSIENKNASATKDPEDKLKDLRVLVVATTFPRWESDSEPRFVFDLTKHLAEKVPLWVLAPHAPGAKVEEEINGVRIRRFPYFFPKQWQNLCYEGGILPKLKARWLARLQLPFFLAAQFIAIWRAVVKYEINFIHCHWIIPQGFFVALIKRLTGVPYILTALGADVYAFKGNSLVKRLKRYTLKNAFCCTVNSDSVENVLTRINSKTRFHYNPNGVDEELFCDDQKNPALKKQLGIQGMFLLGVGRFAEKKGFDYLIASMPKILARQPSAKLVLVGFGPEEEALRQQVDSLRLADSVIFAGSRSGKELAEYYATADIFIGPSIIVPGGDTEGQGVVFLEALASKTAVVASNVGGIPDMVEDGVTGLLVAEKDSNAIAGKVLLLCENSELRKTLAENGRRLVLEKYCWETVASQFLKIYKTAPIHDPFTA